MVASGVCLYLVPKHVNAILAFFISHNLTGFIAADVSGRGTRFIMLYNVNVLINQAKL